MLEYILSFVSDFIIDFEFGLSRGRDRLLGRWNNQGDIEIIRALKWTDFDTSFDSEILANIQSDKF